MGGCGGREGRAPSGSQGDKGERRSRRKCVVCVGETFLHQPPWRLPPPPGAELRGQALQSPRCCRSRPAPGLAHLPTWSWRSSLGCLQLAALSPELPLWRPSLVPPWELLTVPSHQQISITGSYLPPFLGPWALSAWPYTRKHALKNR